MSELIQENVLVTLQIQCNSNGTKELYGGMKGQSLFLGNYSITPVWMNKSDFSLQLFATVAGTNADSVKRIPVYITGTLVGSTQDIEATACSYCVIMSGTISGLRSFKIAEESKNCDASIAQMGKIVKNYPPHNPSTSAMLISSIRQSYIKQEDNIMIVKTNSKVVGSMHQPNGRHATLAEREFKALQHIDISKMEYVTNPAPKPTSPLVTAASASDKVKRIRPDIISIVNNGESSNPPKKSKPNDDSDSDYVFEEPEERDDESLISCN